MYKKIIATIGLSHGLSPRTLAAAQAMCDDGGKVIAVHVIEPVAGFASYYLPPNHQEEVRKSAMAAMAERIGDMKNVEPVILIGNAGHALTEYAEEIGADLIIVGSHRPEFKDYLLGATAARIVRHAPCSVHVLR